MNPEVRSRVESAARQVREWAEHRAGQGDDLTGWCARASAQLWLLLDQLGIASEIHMWSWHRDESAHVFLVVDDHVVDVTATQFGPFRRVPVLIQHKRLAEAHEFYRTERVFHSAEDLRAHQVRNRWPRAQVAWSQLQV